MRKLLGMGAVVWLVLLTMSVVVASAKPDPSNKSCTEAKKVKIEKCTAFVLWDSMPLDQVTVGGHGTSAPTSGILGFNDVAAGFPVSIDHDVLLASIDIPLWWLYGENNVDVLLVIERAREPLNGGLPFAPDDSVVLEQWSLQGIAGGSPAIYHLESTLNPRLSADQRYWVFITARNYSVNYIEWPTAVGYTGEGWFSERNTSHPDWVTHYFSAESKPFRITALH
jgi:hypothetical protein